MKIKNFYELLYHCQVKDNIKIALEGSVLDQLLLAVSEEI